MLYIHCTAKLAKATGTTLEAAPEPDGLYWLDRWYATLVPLKRAKDLFLVTKCPKPLFNRPISEGGGPSVFRGNG